MTDARDIAEPNWLEQQVAADTAEVNQWPEWMKQAAALEPETPHMVNVSSDQDPETSYLRGEISSLVKQRDTLQARATTAEAERDALKAELCDVVYSDLWATLDAARARTDAAEAALRRIDALGRRWSLHQESRLYGVTLIAELNDKD